VDFTGFHPENIDFQGPLQTAAGGPKQLWIIERYTKPELGFFPLPVTGANHERQDRKTGQNYPKKSSIFSGPFAQLGYVYHQGRDTVFP
jgi:hypothetical protein